LIFFHNANLTDGVFLIKTKWLNEKSDLGGFALVAACKGW